MVGAVVGFVVGLVVGALVVDGVVAGAVLLHAQAHKENAIKTPIKNTAILFILNPPFIQITKIVFPVPLDLDWKRLCFE